ncbi:hypothetical protein EON78_06650, partial [bacterium]
MSESQLAVMKRILPNMDKSEMVKLTVELRNPLDPVKANAQIEKYKSVQTVIETNIRTQTAEKTTKSPDSAEYKTLDKSIKSLQKDLQISKAAISLKESGIKAAEELPKLPRKIKDLETKLARSIIGLNTVPPKEEAKLKRVIEGLKTDIKSAKDDITNHKYTVALANGGLDELLKQRREIRASIQDLNEKIAEKTRSAAVPTAPEKIEIKDNINELSFQKEMLSLIGDKILKLPNSIKAGSTQSSVQGFQASKVGENLIQKVMATKIYETDATGTAKVSTMLRDYSPMVKVDNFHSKGHHGFSTDTRKMKDSMKTHMEPVAKAHLAGAEAHKDDHQKFGWENVKEKSVSKPSEMINLI